MFVLERVDDGLDDDSRGRGAEGDGGGSDGADASASASTSTEACAQADARACARRSARHDHVSSTDGCCHVADLDGRAIPTAAIVDRIHLLILYRIRHVARRSATVRRSDYGAAAASEGGGVECRSRPGARSRSSHVAGSVDDRVAARRCGVSCSYESAGSCAGSARTGTDAGRSRSADAGSARTSAHAGSTGAGTSER